MSVLCGRPTPTGPCRRPIVAVGSPCGASHTAATPPAMPAPAAPPTSTPPDPIRPTPPGPLIPPPGKGRDLLAVNSDTAPEVLAVLAGDPSPDIRAAVAANPNTGPEVLARLADDDGDVPVDLTRPILGARQQIRWNVAANPHTGSEVLARLADDDDQQVRRWTAANPATPPTTLARLARDDAFVARAAAAGNPSTPRRALARLARDAEPSVRAAVAANPSSPRRALVNLARSARRRSRSARRRSVVAAVAAVAANPECPKWLLARLASHRSDDVRVAVAVNPRTGRRALRRIAKLDWAPSAKIAEARLPETTPARIAELAAGEAWQPRVEIAGRRDLLAGVLADLAVDPHPLVRAAARTNPDFEGAVAAHAGLLTD